MVAALKRTGQYNNTLIMLTSDNGTSGEGGLNGTFNESRVLNAQQTTLEENMKHYDDWGGPDTYQPCVKQLQTERSLRFHRADRQSSHQLISACYGTARRGN